MKHKRKKKLSNKKLQQVIIKYMAKAPKKQFNPRQLSKLIDSDNNIDSILYALETLQGQNIIFQKDKYKYQINKGVALQQQGGTTYEGYVDMTRSGAGFILVDELEQDIFVPGNFLMGAMNGDRVKVVTRKNGRHTRRKEGKVIKIVERATNQFVAKLRVNNKFALAFPENDQMPLEIDIPIEDINGGKDGNTVIVKITKWPTKSSKSPIGKVVRVLSEKNPSDLEMQSILINSGFSLDFSEEILSEIAHVTDAISTEELAIRRDFRPITTLTIDPYDAKDFDDALSIQHLDNGDLEVGIHIADVTHYVKEDSLLDKEAFDRSTSVYLVDRVCPMLPEKLSNDLCSLRPNVDRLAFSAVFTFGKNKNIKKRWFGRTVIHSDRRFSYEEAQEVLDNGAGDYHEELSLLNEYAYALRKQRYAQGSISFETDEIKFKLADDGTPIELYIKHRKDTHLLVEDFMLLANKEVAEYIDRKSKGKKKIPFVYRIHDLPDIDKLADFARFAGSMGVKIDIQTPKNIVKSFNDLTEKAQANPDLKILVIMGVRTMSKAVYSTENIGHYGLGFDHYTHFTSPIRRYSDVLVHRILAKNLEKSTILDQGKLEAQCRHISNQERKAVDAERQSVRYKQVEYMQQYLGKSFEGIIRGIGEAGFFVELVENFCDGMVPFTTLGERFRVERGRMQARGLRSGKRIKIGDHVEVLVASTNLDKRTVEFELV